MLRFRQAHPIVSSRLIGLLLPPVAVVRKHNQHHQWNVIALHCILLFCHTVRNSFCFILGVTAFHRIISTTHVFILFLHTLSTFSSPPTAIQENRLTCSGSVDEGAKGYLDIHSKDVETRNSNYKSLVNAYYDLATVFYEWGWGPCFHFHYRFPFESFWEGTRRHEYQLAAKLNVTRDHGKVLDVGCGIGGPMRNICRFLNCESITGVTLNPYQVDRGNEIGARDPTVAHRTKLVQGDFMNLSNLFEENYFQAAYAIEATCHAPDRVGVYKQVYNVLEPGG